ncbi:MAG: 16S rRNA (uracil(1498)-N(3))-methyltransferase [Clostridia bacterium]|nr:16S rRNA (uracil(1498)-N(3))-methyltransferase [Clostridia bacterium]
MKNKRYYVNNEIFEDSDVTIEGDEFVHLSSVMRSRVGDTVTLFCGDSFDYNGTIIEISKKYAVVHVDEKVQGVGFPEKNVTLFQALVKGDKLYIVVQKCTELGVHEIVHFESAFSDVKVGNKNIEKLEKVVISACKQCGSSVITKTNRELKFNQMLDEIKNHDAVLFAYEKQGDNHISNVLKKIQNLKNVAVIVGAEGGFSEDEAKQIVAAGAIPVSLGDRILRAETAGIVLPALVLLGVE